MTINYELLKCAYAIISNIPEERFDLNEVYQPCGTIACALGWLSQHPDFNALGLTAFKLPSNNREKLRLKYNNGPTTYAKAAMAIFNITRPNAESLFTPVGASSYDKFYCLSLKDGQTLNHKNLFLYRLQYFLTEKCQWKELTA